MATSLAFKTPFAWMFRLISRQQFAPQNLFGGVFSGVQTREMGSPLSKDLDETAESNKLNELLQGAFDFTNRNARPPKKSNHGARPCSSVMRRLKKKYYYRRTKEAMTPEMEPKKSFDV